MPEVKHSRGNKADFITLAAGNGLVDGQHYNLVDSQEIAVATSASTYYIVGSGSGGGAASLVHFAGELQFSTDNQWRTSSDKLKGVWDTNHNQGAGTGVDPSVEWESRGVIVPAGRTIKNIIVEGRVNNGTEVTDIEMYFLLKTPDPITRWDSGYDGDGEHVIEEVYRDNWYTPSVGATFTGNINDTHARVLSVDHSVTDLSYLEFYAKPIGTLTQTRDFNYQVAYEIE